jgi:hypothetical protein
MLSSNRNAHDCTVEMNIVIARSEHDWNIPQAQNLLVVVICVRLKQCSGILGDLPDFSSSDKEQQ